MSMRKARVDLSIPAEMRLRDALAAIERMPPDERLTKASIAVDDALRFVGDYVDEQLRAALEEG